MGCFVFFCFFCFLRFSGYSPFHNWCAKAWMMNLLISSCKLLSCQVSHIYLSPWCFSNEVKLKHFIRQKKKKELGCSCELSHRCHLLCSGCVNTQSLTKSETQKERQRKRERAILFNHLKTQRGMKWYIWDKWKINQKSCQGVFPAPF